MTQQDNHRIRCHITMPFDCSYLPGSLASNQVIDPTLALNPTLLGALLNNGFRRSGSHVYRPQCPNCQQCISIRVPLDTFKPNRSQQRNWRRNQGLHHVATTAEFRDDQFELYKHYLAARHQDSEMNNPIPADYIGFLTAPNVKTIFHEFRQKDQLVAIAVADHTPNGLSAVYTFFDPNYTHLGLGTYAILWLIQHARELGLPWVYLGYWIRDCRKMSYKTRFKPCEGYIDNTWQKIKS